MPEENHLLGFKIKEIRYINKFSNMLILNRDPFIKQFFNEFEMDLSVFYEVISFLLELLSGVLPKNLSKKLVVGGRVVFKGFLM